MSGPDWTLEDDHKTVAINFPTDPPVALRLEASQVEDILLRLGEFRAMMVPEVPADWSGERRVYAVPDPRWHTQPDMMQGDSIIHIRDPRFGWLSYVLPKESARKLGEHLVKQAEAPDPTQPPDKAN